jgi:hypothetical protein
MYSPNSFIAKRASPPFYYKTSCGRTFPSVNVLISENYMHHIGPVDTMKRVCASSLQQQSYCIFTVFFSTMPWYPSGIPEKRSLELKLCTEKGLDEDSLLRMLHIFSSLFFWNNKIFVTHDAYSPDSQANWHLETFIDWVTWLDSYVIRHVIYSDLGVSQSCQQVNFFPAWPGMPAGRLMSLFWPRR